MIKLRKLLKENADTLTLNIKPGDIILSGKFRNKQNTVASFSKDENNQPVVITTSGKKIKILSVRIQKLMPRKKDD